MSIILASFSLNLTRVEPQLTALTDPLQRGETFGSGDRPIVSVRFATNGDILEAVGDTGAALSYSKVGEWLTNVNNVTGSDWELNFSVDSETGQAGTWTGSTRGSFIDIGTQRTFSWTKDTTGLGTASSEVTCTVREVSNTSNTTTRSALNYDATIEV